MSEGIDAEAKSLLEGQPPQKLAPADTVGFTLVLLSKPRDLERLRLALAKAGCSDAGRIDAVLREPCPLVVTTGLTVEYAVFGQSELACCDSTAVFVRDEVVAANDRPYLRVLYSGLLRSDEFQLVDVELVSVLAGDQGERFLQQFFGTDASGFRMELPLRQPVARKKARLISHWAKKIGAEVRVQGL